MAEMEAQQESALEPQREDIEELKLQHERELARVLGEIVEWELQHQRESPQRLREIEEEQIQQRAIVQSRQRKGVQMPHENSYLIIQFNSTRATSSSRKCATCDMKRFVICIYYHYQLLNSIKKLTFQMIKNI